jgi:hypothetical protein
VYSHQTLTTSRRAALQSVLSPSPPSLTAVPHCHCQRHGKSAQPGEHAARNTQHARGKVAESRSGRKTLARSRSLARLLLALSLARSCKQKDFLACSSSTKSGGGRYNIRQPVGARAATTRRRNTARLVVVLRATHSRVVDGRANVTFSCSCGCPAHHPISAGWGRGSDGGGCGVTV